MNTEAIEIKRGGQPTPMQRSLQGVAVSGVTLLLFLAVYSFEVGAEPASNLVGPAGHYLSKALTLVLGLPVLALPFFGVFAAVQLFRGRRVAFGLQSVIAASVFLTSICMLLALMDGSIDEAILPRGGLLGLMLKDGIAAAFGVAGAGVIGATAMFGSAVYLLRVIPSDAVLWLRGALRGAPPEHEEESSSGELPIAEAPDSNEFKAVEPKSGLREKLASMFRRHPKGDREAAGEETQAESPESFEWVALDTSADDSGDSFDWSFGDAAPTPPPAPAPAGQSAPDLGSSPQAAGDSSSEQSPAANSAAAESSGTLMLGTVAPRREPPLKILPRARKAAASADGSAAVEGAAAGRQADAPLSEVAAANSIDADYTSELSRDFGGSSVLYSPLLNDLADEPPAQAERERLGDAPDSGSSDSGAPNSGAHDSVASPVHARLAPVGEVVEAEPLGKRERPQPRPAQPPADASAERGFGPTIEPCDSIAKPKDVKDLIRSERANPISEEKRAEWEFPSLSHLAYAPPSSTVDEDSLRDKAVQLEQAFANFKINGTVTAIRPGPVITMFEFEPEAGVRLNRITNLQDDVKMALAAESVRIIAPLPGRGCVGIEVPNETRETVYLREILADDAFRRDIKSPLAIGLGADVEGKPVVADLAKMPHLLVAGTTGSGKSVAVNAMLTSILYRASPDDVKMILIDPKQLELAVYGNAPHLLLPVVTEPAKAAVALNWAVNDMEDRYTLLSEMRVRNIAGYNKRLKEIQAKYGSYIDPEIDPEQLSPDERLIQAVEPNGKLRHRHMPYLVVVIDEFADLIMIAGKDVEVSVARLAQKARAAGIHVILATQRPSVDVLTGLIKANFPTRMSFRLISGTDSRTVLDSVGAENLLGMGDMLYRPPGSSTLERVHGAWVDEREIEEVVNFLAAQKEPEFDESILEVPEEDDSGGGNSRHQEDDLYPEALDIVYANGYGSISSIQQELSIGYNRAAKIYKQMEREGVFGNETDSHNRKLVKPRKTDS